MDFGLILGGFLVGFPSIFGEVSGRCFARFLIKCSTIFGLLARFLVDCSSAVAGTAALLRFGYSFSFYHAEFESTSDFDIKAFRTRL